MTLIEAATLLSSVAAVIAAASAFFQAMRTHRAVNSRMDTMLALMRSAGIAEGKATEKEEQGVRDAAVLAPIKVEAVEMTAGTVHVHQEGPEGEPKREGPGHPSQD